VLLGNVEPVDVETVGLARAEWIRRREREQGVPKRLRVLDGDLGAAILARRRQVTASRRVRHDQPLPNRVVQLLAQRDNNVDDGARRLAIRFEVGNEGVYVAWGDRVERTITEYGQDMPAQV
jgi:hypothetical protein